MNSHSICLVHRWISKQQLVKFINLDSMITSECHVRERGFSLSIEELIPFYPWPTHSCCIPSSLPVSSHTFPSTLFSFSTYHSTFLLLLSYIQHIWTIALLKSLCLIRCPSLTSYFFNQLFPLFSCILNLFLTNNFYFFKKHVPLHCKIHWKKLPLTFSFPWSSDSLITKFFESIGHVHCFYLHIIDKLILQMKQIQPLKILFQRFVSPLSNFSEFYFAYDRLAFPILLESVSCLQFRWQSTILLHIFKFNLKKFWYNFYHI